MSPVRRGIGFGSWRTTLTISPGPVAVAAGVGLRLTDRGGLVPPPTTEERTEPPKHATSVAESLDGA